MLRHATRREKRASFGRAQSSSTRVFSVFSVLVARRFGPSRCRRPALARLHRVRHPHTLANTGRGNHTSSNMPRPANPGLPGAVKPGVPPAPSRGRSSAPTAARGGGTGYGVAKKKAEPKKKDPDAKIAALKERLARGHRLTDDELAQLEMAAVARWTPLEREDEEAEERRKEEEEERERAREEAARRARRAAQGRRRRPRESGKGGLAGRCRATRAARDAGRGGAGPAEAGGGRLSGDRRAARDEGAAAAAASYSAPVPQDFALQPPPAGAPGAQDGDLEDDEHDDSNGAPALASSIYADADADADNGEAYADAPETTRPPPEVAAAVTAAFSAAAAEETGQAAAKPSSTSTSPAASEQPRGAAANASGSASSAQAPTPAASTGSGRPLSVHTPSGKCWSTCPAGAPTAGAPPAVAAAGGFGAKASKPKKPKPPPPPKDPLTALRDASFEEFVADRRRLALQAGEEPQGSALSRRRGRICPTPCVCASRRWPRRSSRRRAAAMAGPQRPNLRQRCTIARRLSASQLASRRRRAAAASAVAAAPAVAAVQAGECAVLRDPPTSAIELDMVAGTGARRMRSTRRSRRSRSRRRRRRRRRPSPKAADVQRR